MTDIKVAYSAETAVTITLASNATGVVRASTEIDNTTNKYRNAKLQVKFKTGTGTTATSTLQFWISGSNDGVKYTDGATGADGVVTLTVPPNATWVGRCNCPTASTSYNSDTFDLQKAWGGPLPPYFVIFVQNLSNSTLSSTAGDHAVTLVFLYDTV